MRNGQVFTIPKMTSRYGKDFIEKKWQLFLSLDEIDPSSHIPPVPSDRNHGSLFSRALEAYTDRMRLAASVLSLSNMIKALSKPGLSDRTKAAIFLRSIEDVSDTEFLAKLKSLKKYGHWGVFHALTVDEFHSVVQRYRRLGGSRLLLRW